LEHLAALTGIQACLQCKLGYSLRYIAHQDAVSPIVIGFDGPPQAASLDLF